MQRKTLLMLVGVLIVLFAGIFAVWRLTTSTLSVPPRTSLGDKVELYFYYDRAVEYEGKIKAEQGELTNYIVASNSWKFLGDFTKDPVWYRLAMQALDRARDLTQDKNTLVLGNAAQIAEALGEYDQAKELYIKAIDITPGDANLWLQYIRLTRYKLKVSEFNVLRAYDDAMSRVVGGADLVSSRADYLKEIGRYEDARVDYALLLKNNVITQQQFDQEISEMEQLKTTNN